MNRTRIKHPPSSNHARAIWPLTLAAALCGPLGAWAQAAAGSAAERAPAAAPAPAPMPMPSGNTASLGTPPGTPPPPAGSATNPRAPLSCQLMANSSGNGTGAGGAGVIQLVSGPGLASGGAWASAQRPGKSVERTVNFNYAFSNFGQLITTLLPRPEPRIQYRVDKATTFIYTADGGINGPRPAELSGVLNGSQRGWSWNDSVTQTRLANSAPFNNDWRIDLRLSGQRVNTVLAAPSEFFEVFVRCELPVRH